MSENGKLKIIPLGGLEAIGMNITAFEFGDSIIVVDCGLAFPETDMLGVDLVIPDIREGEYSISAIWSELYRRIIASDEGREYEKITEKEVLEKYPITYKLDFRMH